MAVKLSGNGLYESSRMILPEHREAMARRQQGEVFRVAKGKTAKRPTRDEFELEDLGEQLTEAKQEGNEVVLTVWGSDPVRGRIVELDARTRLVHVERYGAVAKVPFLDIMKVSNPED